MSRYKLYFIGGPEDCQSRYHDAVPPENFYFMQEADVRAPNPDPSFNDSAELRRLHYRRCGLVDGYIHVFKYVGERKWRAIAEGA